MICDSQVSRRSAVYTPAGMPSTSASSAAVNASSNVAGNRSLSSVDTGTPLPQRQTEFAMCGAIDEARELDVERLIEPEVGTQPRAVLLRRILTDHESHRIAGEVEQPEGDERHYREDGE